MTATEPQLWKKGLHSQFSQSYLRRGQNTPSLFRNKSCDLTWSPSLSLLSGAARPLPLSEPHVSSLPLLKPLLPRLLPQQRLLPHGERAALPHHHPPCGEEVRLHPESHQSLHGRQRRVQRASHGLGKRGGGAIINFIYTYTAKCVREAGCWEGRPMKNRFVRM